MPCGVETTATLLVAEGKNCASHFMHSMEATKGGRGVVLVAYNTLKIPHNFFCTHFALLYSSPPSTTDMVFPSNIYATLCIY